MACKEDPYAVGYDAVMNGQPESNPYPLNAQDYFDFQSGAADAAFDVRNSEPSETPPVSGRRSREMTVEQWVKDQLERCGMVGAQIDAVMERVKADESTNAMHWSSPKDGYPDVMYPVLMLTVAVHALAYIDDELPLAWFRPIFAQLSGEQATQ